MLDLSIHPRYIYIYIYILQGRTLAALKLLFEEIMEIFPDEYIHFGADEIGFQRFSNCNFRSKWTSLGLHADMCQNTVYALAKTDLTK